MGTLNTEGAADHATSPDLAAIRIWPGEQKAWEAIGQLDPGDVCRKAEAVCDGAIGLFEVCSFGTVFRVAPGRREISSPSALGQRLLNTHEYFFRLSVLWYLACARDVPLSGKLLKPVHMKGGQMFARGTHVLPLNELAEKYTNHRGKFLRRGAELGGEPWAFGDAAIRLPAFPRVPVFVILWEGDDEFPPRADLMFDSTGDQHLPTDVMWSIATMSVLLMLDDV